jgi:hypothetical protein
MPRRKGANGTGGILTVNFDTSDPSERRALEAARLLAAKHGRRKQVVIALLEAVYNHYDQTGEVLTAPEISAFFAGKGRQLVTAPPSDSPRTFATAKPSEPGVVITGSSKADARTVADNFLKSMGAAFFD